ncbi:MAG: hypothetical protein NT167_11740 [Verrucomicrobia bacterium]|nr:hypothetical protein [Verrucomicrobiota bacterium]
MVMHADISEKGLETLIMRHMTGTDGLAPVAEGLVAETPMPFRRRRLLALAGSPAIPRTYDRTYALDGHPAAQVESGGLTVEAVAD